VRIPKDVQVGPQIFTVVEEMGMLGRGSAGEMDPVQSKILLEAQLVPTRKVRTFTHEVLEAMNSVWDVGLKHHQIDLLASAWVLFIHDNPEVFDAR
jgi:hypothetical protein